ncbi:phage holin [Streptococcus gallolyticus subsp. gallolyticus]|uniref:phage holin n=1 Tax=Streptococcus gallolyticus TaxID=315405 RepID=UPI00228486E2|nr:phage holin [Streptococcus gallolyticus]MCY7152113.1 phage holin [Streptococcus gallolyticus subsp. gallolyticus]MCY7174925.1 phage holin [Streptococcus gallolyticus subsp. gallolyticus]MCY7175148.1 phage holin [Streptococcus gallolyticus subsp. gallolyticus]MCY7181207.1 phage holin [Streptococcus gallolyticus subsp. gallolyticus]MCY7198593.1 phage holin [Streptococcus gallolyticus subsp. gallolyticus]
MTKIINDLKNVTAGTWVRVVLFLLGVVNYFLAALGIDIIKFDNEQITQLVNAVYIAVTGFYTLWKNNNFTAEAQEAQQYLDDMKTVKGNVQPTTVVEEKTEDDDIVLG